MRLPLSFLFLILLTLTLATALPGGGPPPSAPKKKPPPPNELATWNCTHKVKAFHSHYKLRGRDWNKTEAQIKKSVADEGMIKRWKYREFQEYGKPSFESSFNLPWGRSKAVGQYTSGLLGINKQHKNPKTGKKWIGVECPKVCADC